MRTAHPKLEEIRKRLRMPHDPSTPRRYITPKGAGEASLPVSQQSQRVESEGAINLEESLGAGSLTSPDPNVEEAHMVQRSPANMEEAAAGGTPQSLDGLAQAVATLFEPVRQYEGRLAEITEASESISYVTRAALELCEPLKSFHEQIRKLSRSFESMWTFRDELNMLAESFAPVRALHAQIIQLAETVRTHLVEVANGLEPAKALRLDIADLALAIDAVSELQAEFYALSNAFGDATDSKAAGAESTEDSLA